MIYGKNTQLISGKSSDLTKNPPTPVNRKEFRFKTPLCIVSSDREPSICVFYMVWVRWRLKSELFPVNSRFACFTWFGWGGISITTANHTTTTHNLKLKQTLVTYLMYPVLHLDITYCEKFMLQVRPCIYIANFTRFRSKLLNIELSSKSDTVSHFGL